MRDPRTHGGRHRAGQPPHRGEHGASQPSFCPGWIFLLPSGPRQTRSSHLSHLIPPGTAAAAEEPQCARAAPPAAPQAPGPPRARRHGRGRRERRVPAPARDVLGARYGTRALQGGSWKCFPTGRKARSPSVSDADGTLHRTGKGQQDFGVVAPLV